MASGSGSAFSVEKPLSPFVGLSKPHRVLAFCGKARNNKAFPSLELCLPFGEGTSQAAASFLPTTPFLEQESPVSKKLTTFRATKLLQREDVISVKCDNPRGEQPGPGPVSNTREHHLKGFS